MTDDDLPETDNPENLIDPLDALLSEDAPSPVLGPTGFQPQLGVLGMPPPIPAATPETFICLKDCRYYFEQKLLADLMNVEGTEGLKRHQKSRYCMRMASTAIDLMDEHGVLECSEWHPWTNKELAARAKARDEYAARSKDKTNGK